jgi:hypothetical protein
MRKMSFVVLGVLVGAAVATAWAQIPVSPGLSSPEHAAIIDPTEMMGNARPLPVENHDAF